MTNWSRPIGSAVTLAALALLVVLGLRLERPPDADLRNGQVFIQDNLTSDGALEYGVWVGSDGTPFAGRRTDRGDWRVVDLSRLPGNPLAAPTRDDTHNIYVAGVDARGSVHIAGNMHDEPLRYVRSAPDRLAGWRSTPAPRGAERVTYPAFTSLPDGTLLFWRRVGVAGRGHVVLDELRPGASRWRSLGTVLDGRPTGESPYLNRIATDPRTGTIHLLFEWRATEDPDTTNDVGYARSRDGGRTWERSDGTRLRRPITHESAETVIDTLPSGSGLLNSGGLAVDSEGRPHGVVTWQPPTGEPAFEHVWLDGDNVWRRERLSDLGLEGRAQIAATPDGRIWLLGVDAGEVVAVDVTPGQDDRERRTLASVPVGWAVNFDSLALARAGELRMLIPDGSEPHVVEVSLGVGSGD